MYIIYMPSSSSNIVLFDIGSLVYKTRDGPETTYRIIENDGTSYTIQPTNQQGDTQNEVNWNELTPVSQDTYNRPNTPESIGTTRTRTRRRSPNRNEGVRFTNAVVELTRRGVSGKSKRTRHNARKPKGKPKGKTTRR